MSTLAAVAARRRGLRGAGGVVPPDPDPPDPSSVRVAPTADWAYLIGPQSVPSTVPPGWADVPPHMESAQHKYIPLYEQWATEVPGFVPAAGTVSVQNGSSTVTGIGTTFGTSPMTQGRGVRIYDAAASVWRYFQFRSVDAGAQAAVLGKPSSSNPQPSEQVWDGTTQSGLTIEKANLATNSNGMAIDVVMNDPNDGYYDRVYALYQAWMRVDDCSPTSTILAAARNMMDNWAATERHGNFTYQSSNGWNTAGARNGMILGIICRAVDGRPEWWPAIVNYVDYHHYTWIERRKIGGPFQDSAISTRDAGYTINYCAAVAACHPDAGVRALYAERAISGAIDPCLRGPSSNVFATSPDRRSWIGGNNNFDANQDGFYDFTPSTQEGYYGGGGTFAAQPFLQALMVEALVNVHRMMRKNGLHLTDTSRYNVIGDAIVAGVEGWRTSFIPHAAVPNIRGMPYWYGRNDHFRADQPVVGGAPVSGVQFITLPGQPADFGVFCTSTDGSAEGSSGLVGSSFRSNMADGIGSLGYAHLLAPDRGFNTFAWEAVDACFRAERQGTGLSATGGDGIYSLWQKTTPDLSQVYGAVQGKHWNQHYRHIMKGLGWFMRGTLEDFS